MITEDKLNSVKATMDRLIEHGTGLYDDIAETAKDRERLLVEAEERERTIEKLNNESDQAAAQINDLEMRNTRLAHDVVRLESELADATSRLDAIREHANGNGSTARKSGERLPAHGNLAQLLSRAGQPKEQRTSE